MIKTLIEKLKALRIYAVMCSLKHYFFVGLFMLYVIFIYWFVFFL